jgi:hypothetical protein
MPPATTIRWASSRIHSRSRFSPVRDCRFEASGLLTSIRPLHGTKIPESRDRRLVRNVVAIPSAALGGALYGGLAPPSVGRDLAGSPTLAFGTASAVCLLGAGCFLAFGEEFAAYRTE